MITLTQDQIDQMADSFEENFTDKPAPVAVKRAKRAPKRPHVWWWDAPQESKDLVMAKAGAICDDILSRKAEQNTITVTTKTGTKGFRWTAGPGWGLSMLMRMVVLASLEGEDIYQPDDRTEDGSLRRSDIRGWVDAAIQDAFVRKNRMEHAV